MCVMSLLYFRCSDHTGQADRSLETVHFCLIGQWKTSMKIMECCGGEAFE